MQRRRSLVIMSIASGVVALAVGILAQQPPAGSAAAGRGPAVAPPMRPALLSPGGGHGVSGAFNLSTIEVFAKAVPR